jgi:hypothetical protein
MSFKPVMFGSGKAYEVQDAIIKKHVETMIPAELYNRHPCKLTHQWVPYVVFNTYSLTPLPIGDRALFVMTTLKGKKMCFLVMVDHIYLVSMCINTKTMFNGSVMEGYIKIDQDTGRYHLQISDIFMSDGVQTDGIPFGFRHLMLLLFISTTLQPRASDAVLMSVPACIDGNRFTELYNNRVPMILQPDHDFEYQRKNRTYLHYTPAAD